MVERESTLTMPQRYIRTPGGSTLGELIPVLVTGSTCRGKVVAAVERRLQKEDQAIVEH
jgi:hypothetical protein